MALSDKAKKNTRKSISFMFLFVLCIFWVVPIFFLIILSLKTTKDYASHAYYALPNAFGFFDNIKYVWVKTNLGISQNNALCNHRMDDAV